MTDLECAKQIKRSLSYRLGLLANRARHPLRSWGKSLDMDAADVAAVVRQAGRYSLVSDPAGAARVCAESMAKTQAAARQRERYGFDPLLWLAIAELVARVALWIWERGTD